MSVRKVNRVLGVGLVVALAGVSGCDGQDEATVAIESARNTLASVSGSSAVPASMREQKLGQVVSALQQASGDAGEESGAIIAGLMGDALAGQADILASRFRDADARLLRALNRADSLLNLLRTQRSLADALSGYDPTEDLAALDEQARELGSRLASTQEALEANEARIGELRQQAEGLEARTSELAERENELRRQMNFAGSAERPEVARRAYEVRREREVALREAEALRVLAERMAPASAEIRLSIRQVETQIGSIEATKQMLREKQRTEREASEAARREAESVAARVGEAAQEVLAIVRDDLQPAASAALSKYGEAASKWNQARSGPSRSVASTRAAAVQHAIASVQREYAESLTRAARVLGEAGGVRPPVEGSAQLREAAEQMVNEAEEALGAAADAYEAASSGLASGEGGGGLGERLARIAREIRGEPEPVVEEEVIEEEVIEDGEVIEEEEVMEFEEGVPEEEAPPEG